MGPGWVGWVSEAAGAGGTGETETAGMVQNRTRAAHHQTGAARVRGQSFFFASGYASARSIPFCRESTTFV